MTKAKANRWSATLETYFGVADEIYDSIVKKQDQTKPFGDIHTDGLTLADLEDGYVAKAKEWADTNNAPWPPYLPWAEEYSLAHPEARER